MPSRHRAIAPLGSAVAALACVDVATWAGGELGCAAALGAGDGAVARGGAGGDGGGAAAAGTGGAVRSARGGVGALSAAPALATPPWPWHAPRPAFEVAPSLQVTVAAEPEGSAAAVGALAVEPALADLST